MQLLPVTAQGQKNPSEIRVEFSINWTNAFEPSSGCVGVIFSITIELISIEFIVWIMKIGQAIAVEARMPKKTILFLRKYSKRSRNTHGEIKADFVCFPGGNLRINFIVSGVWIHVTSGWYSIRKLPGLCTNERGSLGRKYSAALQPRTRQQRKKDSKWKLLQVFDLKRAR